MTGPQPATLSCPDCGEPLTRGVPSCSACGLPLTGPVAARLWQVDQQLTVLQAEREDLLVRLRSGDGGQVPVPSAVPGTTARLRGLTTQQLLLATGGVLVLVAALVFLAVAWDLIGVAGQVTVMVLAAASAAALADRLGRRGLRSGAEALALVAAGLLAVDLAAAHRLDLAGLGSLDGRDYLTGALVVAAVLLAGTAAAVRLLWSFAVAAVVAGALVPVAALDASGGGPVPAAAVLVATAAALHALTHVLPLSDPARRAGHVTAWAFGAGYLLLGAVTAVVAGFDGEFAPSGGQPSVVAALLVALAATAVSAGVARTLDAAVPWRPPLVRAYLGGAVVTLVATGTGCAWHGGAPALCLTGLAGAAMAVLGAVVTRASAARAGAAGAPRAAEPATQRWLVAMLSGHLLTAASVLALIALAEVAGERSPVLLALTLAVASVAAAVTTVLLAGPIGVLVTAAGAGYAAVAAVSAAAAPPQDTRAWRHAAAIGLAAAGVASVAGRVRRVGEVEQVLGLVAAGGFLVAAAGPASLERAVALSVALALGGLTALAYSALPERGALAYVGVLGCSSATWVLLTDREVDLVEAYTLPLTVLAAAVGAVVWRRRPDAPSWQVAGPALSAALLPSALATVDDPALTRPLLVVLVALVVVLVGLRVRWQSPVVVGSAALLVVAASQLAPYAVGAPRWTTLGLAGVLLLALGIRYEQARRGAGGAVRWLTSMQ